MIREFDTIISKIKEYDKICLFHHTLPDGDSISSSYSLGLAIKEAYPHKTIKWISDRKYLKNNFEYINFDPSFDIDEIDNTWLAIVGDVAVFDRVYKKEQLVRAKEILCFDHHRNQVNFNNTTFWHQPTWPAAAIMSTKLALELNPNPSPTTALMLLFGVLTDTGNYVYTTVDPLPHETAISLNPFIDSDQMRKFLSEMSKKSLNQLKFESWVYENMVVDGELAYCIIPDKVQKKFKLAADECTDVNLLASIQGVKVWGFFIEYKDTTKDVRLRLRSLGQRVDLFCNRIGGGGHGAAAGAVIKSLNDVNEVVKMLSNFVNDNQ